MAANTLTEADVAYLRGNFLTLDELCAGRAETAEHVRALIERGLLPQPSYRLPDDTGLFPADYFGLVDEAGGPAGLREHFVARYRAARAAAQAEADELEQDWQAFLGGVYGICLREVTPEAIVRKSVLVSSICELLVLARPRSAEWRRTLRARVDELDALEREFAPDHDRSDKQERPPTRDLLIEAARERYPDAFVGAMAPAGSAGNG
jgi:hypothetical protein